MATTTKAVAVAATGPEGREAAGPASAPAEVVGLSEAGRREFERRVRAGQSPRAALNYLIRRAGQVAG